MVVGAKKRKGNVRPRENEKEMMPPGHERQRTSSSVVVLDGMETFAQRVDEENDIAG